MSFIGKDFVNNQVSFNFMKEQNIQTELDLLTLPANELLEKFGEGRHIPGSGSAAAFSGLLAVELMKTVCKLTVKRTEEKYVVVKKDFEYMLKILESDTKPKLIELFQKDMNVFDLVSKYRTARNTAKENNNQREERKFARMANDKLKEATEIPLEIAKTCLNTMDFAFAIFDRGYQATRGDSGVAISNLLSAISGSLFVTLINIRTARQSQWTERLREEAENIGNTYNIKQKLALTKVFELYKEGVDNQNYQLKLNFD